MEETERREREGEQNSKKKKTHNSFLSLSSAAAAAAAAPAAAAAARALSPSLSLFHFPLALSRAPLYPLSPSPQRARREAGKRKRKETDSFNNVAMGKRRGGNDAAAAAAPKPLSHYAHPLIPPFKSKEDLTKALKVGEESSEGTRTSSMRVKKRAILLEFLSSSTHDDEKNQKHPLSPPKQATADALSAAPQAPDGAVSLGPLAGALVDRSLLLHKDKVSEEEFIFLFLDVARRRRRRRRRLLPPSLSNRCLFLSLFLASSLPLDASPAVSDRSSASPHGGENEKRPERLREKEREREQQQHARR